MRIDRSDPADGSGDAPVSRRAPSAPEDLDAGSKESGSAVSGGDPPDSSSADPDIAVRTERTVAYRVVVDAAYRQHAIDHSHAQGETSAEVARKSPQATNETTAVTLDGSAAAAHDGLIRNLTIGNGDHELYGVAARTFGDTPATAPGGDGSIGNGGGTQSPAGDTPPGPEGGDDPEGANGGLGGELVNVNAKDRAADLLAERISGESSVRFANGPAIEFDAVSAEYVAQAKPAHFTLNQAFRNQAKATFEVAIQSGRTPYFQFDGPPDPGVLQTLSRYADRYGIGPVIDLTPLGEPNA